MTRMPSSERLGRLAGLQALAATEHSRSLAGACAETDRRRGEEAERAADLRAAEADLAGVHGGERFCLDRWRLAAAVVGSSANALVKWQQALQRAEDDERQASIDWLTARYRADWLTGRARAARRKEADRQDEKAESEARDLRLALDHPGDEA